MEKKILNISKSPVSTYPALIDFFSILLSSQGTVWEWISDHYIQIAIADRFSDINFYEFAAKGKAEEYADTPFTQYIKLNRDVVTSSFNSFLDFVKNIINEGYAIRVCLDDYYLSCSKHYMERHFIHTTFIYGYDDNHKIIYVADFFDGIKYTYETVSFENIEQSYNSVVVDPDAFEYFLYHIIGIKPINGEYCFNKNLLKLNLESFLYSKDCFKHMEYSYLYCNFEKYFGLNCYDMLAEGPNGMMGYWQVRFFQLILDHKNLMKQRINYLMFSKKIDEDFMLIQKSNNLIQQATIIRNLIIRYNIAAQYNENNLRKHIIELKEKDKDFIEKFLINLK